eukprot:jgi/Tetstr1/437148/TSEL_025908.t1
MVLVLANGKRSCEQQRRLRDGVVFTLRDPVTSIMAAHHAPRVYENGGEAPGFLLGGPTITALGLRPDPATRICTFRAPNRPAGRVPLLSQTAWERRVREHQPVVRVERVSYCHGVELGDDLPPLRDVQSLQRHGLARLSTREEGISMYEPCGGGYVAVLNAMLANGMSRANRNALGLRDRRSRLVFHVAAFIEKLEEKQPTGVGWLLENVDTSGDERLYIKESEKYITKIIGRALVIDEAGCGANHHRVRRFWTNMGDVERLKLAWERRADMQPRLLREVLPPHLRPHVNLPTPPNGVRVNKPGQPRALPTILARPDSDAYSGEGGGMLFNINTDEWERPTVHLKEERFGYEPNVIHGISLPDHERLIGNAMVMVRASARYRREVTATSRAGRRAFGANAVSDGGGTAERSSAAAWANRGYTQASMNDHVEDVRSLKDPEKHWRCGRECEASHQRQLVELCDSFWDDVWVWSVSDLPAVNHWEFRIPTTNTQPIKRPKYRLSKTEWNFVDSCVTESWAYCMPKTDELLSKVAGARMYNGFDAKSAFYQLPIAEEDRHKTAFWGSDRRYEWCRMAMGFKNASQAWQRVMDEALGDLPFVAVYADDICVFSGAAEMSDAEVFQQHLQHLETVFRRLAKAGIRLAPGKGRMAVRQIAFLGHWVDGEGVFPQHSKVEAVVKMPPPTDVAGLRRFLGMVGYYGKFIEQVAVKRKPLTKLTGKEDDEGQEYVVEFASRTCQGAEPNCASYEGECLAMLYGMDKFRYYLFGRLFVVVTDHRPLEWLMNTAQLRGKLARWAMRLSEYHFVVRYRKGVHHVNADCLSRGPVEGDPTELDGRGEFSPEGTVRHAAAFCCATAQSSRQPELSAWARRRVLDTAHEGAADGDLVPVTGELTAGPRRGDPWMDAEAMAELQAGSVNMPKPYARYAWRNNIFWYLHKDGTQREVPPPSERDTVIMDVHVKMGHLGRDRLRSVIALRVRECEASQQRQLVELCDSFWDDVWVWSVSDLPAVNHWEFRIPTTNTQPIKRPKYRLSKTEWNFVDSWCKELLAAVAIRESQSPYKHPSNELLSKVAGARMYNGFDAKSAFYQLPIAEEDRHKTAFWGSDRRYEWCRMAMGFKNASQAWQRVMDEALGDLPFVAVYADDICVFSGAAEMSDAEVFQQHLQHLETVFRRLAKAGIRLAPGKGRMAVRQIAFLGHWVDGEGVFPQHSKVEAVVKMPPPTDVAGLRRFLGMVGYYGKFIEQVAVKRKPLTKLTGKEDDEGQEYVVEFASRTCQGAEPNCASYEGECLAMLYGMDKFRYYLFGRLFVVVTDHRPLEWLMNTAQLRGKLARWAMRLSEYHFVVRYRKGVHHVNADCLSRGPVEGDPTELDGRGEFSPEGTVRHAAAFCCATAQSSRQPELSAWARRRVLDTAHEGAADGDLVPVTGELTAGPRRGDPWMDAEAMAELQAGSVNMPKPYARYAWRNNIFWYLHKDGTQREVPPPSERDTVIMDVHVKMGHLGRDRLRSVIALRVRECEASQQRQLVELCDSFWDDVWVWSVSDLSAVNHWEFRIPTTNTQPIKRPKYRLSKTEWNFVDSW